MKTSVCLGVILLFALPLHAETYSWVDDSGTYNYTEDYSRVPKKYRKKVKRSEELQQELKPQESPAIESALPRPAEKPDAKSAAVPEGDDAMFGGKNRAAWRREMEVLESELSGIEQRMELLKKKMLDAKVLPKPQFDELKKEYDDSRATYDQKYRSYTELVDSIRKAGIEVDIKK